jgi:outer membrane lipoprotein-sorting protein
LIRHWPVNRRRNGFGTIAWSNKEYRMQIKQWLSLSLVGTMTLIGGLAATSARAELPQIDPHQVAVNVDQRDDGNDEISDLEMTLTNNKGQERVRKVIAYRKDYGADSKTLMLFKEPADVKNTGFLSWTYDAEGKDDDQWLYLPAMKKVRRISAGDQKDYFMGTDFTYDDMGSRNVEDYTYKMIGTETIDGVECYHIEMTPKSDDIVKKTGYGKGELWARPDIWMGLKMKFYDKKLNFLKELTLSDIEQIDGIWTAKTMTMVNDQEKHKTVFKFSNIKYNTNLDDETFSERRLTKGVE